jgi:hypothetical protein
VRSALRVPEAMLESLSEFCRVANIPLDVVSTGQAGLDVVEAAQRRPCSLSRLYIGGWISCGRAHGIAARLDIQPRQMGRLLSFFNIKIRHCQLGCF